MSKVLNNPDIKTRMGKLRGGKKWKMTSEVGGQHLKCSMKLPKALVESENRLGEKRARDAKPPWKTQFSESLGGNTCPRSMS